MLGYYSYVQVFTVGCHLQVAWLTPSEIFSPHYGRAIAACMMRTRKEAEHVQPLRIIEIGGGTGTLAADIMASPIKRAPCAKPL